MKRILAFLSLPVISCAEHPEYQKEENTGRDKDSCCGNNCCENCRVISVGMKR